MTRLEISQAFRRDKSVLTAEMARELLDYDPGTGLLTWRERPREWFATDRGCSAWNAQNATRSALATPRGHGYLGGRLFARNVYAHTLAWVVHAGAWPQHEIDHINGRRSDNRFANLRDTLWNHRNKRRRTDNTSGVTGVHWHRGARKWSAETRDRQQHKVYLGLFENFNDAVAARRAAEREHGFHENHNRD